MKDIPEVTKVRFVASVDLPGGMQSQVNSGGLKEVRIAVVSDTVVVRAKGGCVVMVPMSNVAFVVPAPEAKKG